MLYPYHLPEIVVFHKKQLVYIKVPTIQQQMRIARWIGCNVDYNHIRVSVEPCEKTYLMKFSDINIDKVLYVLNLRTMEPAIWSPLKIGIPNKIKEEISKRKAQSCEVEPIVYY